MTELLIYIIAAYIAFKVISGPIGRKALELLGLVRTSKREKGGRATMHDLLDGLFDAGEKTRERARTARERYDDRRDERARDHELDEKREQLTLFFDQQDLVIATGHRGGFEIFLVDTRGNETRLDRKRMERFLGSCERRGLLSRAQQRAMRSFFERYRS